MGRRRARGAKRTGSPTGTPTRGYALHTEPQTKDIIRTRQQDFGNGGAARGERDARRQDAPSSDLRPGKALVRT
jgi:hypothetical protein